MDNYCRIIFLATLSSISISLIGYSQQSSFASVNEEQTYDPNGFEYNYYYAYTEEEREDLSEKYEDIEWYADCPNSPLTKKTTPLEADKRVTELPSIINSTNDDDEKQNLQEEFECLAFKRSIEREQTQEGFDEIKKSFGDSFKIVDLYNQRQDIDRQLSDLINK